MERGANLRWDCSDSRNDDINGLLPSPSLHAAGSTAKQGFISFVGTLIASEANCMETGASSQAGSHEQHITPSDARLKLTSQNNRHFVEEFRSTHYSPGETVNH